MSSTTVGHIPMHQSTISDNILCHYVMGTRFFAFWPMTSAFQVTNALFTKSAYKYPSVQVGNSGPLGKVCSKSTCHKVIPLPPIPIIIFYLPFLWIVHIPVWHMARIMTLLIFLKTHLGLKHFLQAMYNKHLISIWLMNCIHGLLKRDKNKAARDRLRGKEW